MLIIKNGEIIIIGEYQIYIKKVFYKLLIVINRLIGLKTRH